MGADPSGKPSNLSLDDLDAGWDDEPLAPPPKTRVFPKSQPPAPESQALATPVEPEPRPSVKTSVGKSEARLGRSMSIPADSSRAPQPAAPGRSSPPPPSARTSGTSRASLTPVPASTRPSTVTAQKREEAASEAPLLPTEAPPASNSLSSETRPPPREAQRHTAGLLEPDEATNPPINAPGVTSSEPFLAAAPNTLEPCAHQLEHVDPTSAPGRNRSRRSLFVYVGLAVALVLMLGSVAVLTRSGERGDVASRPPSQTPDSTETTQRARRLNPEVPQGQPTRANANTREAAARETAALGSDSSESDAAKTDTSDPASSSSSLLAPAADADLKAPAAAEAPNSAAPGQLVTVTIHASPPEAIIYDEKQRIGKGVARITLRAGRKRSMLALLNLHHPRHFVLDGSQTTVNVTLEPMDANAIARSVATQKRKPTRSSTTAKRSAR